MDVETAFLYGDLEEEIYMEVPVGVNEVNPNSINENDTCFLLEEEIYMEVPVGLNEVNPNSINENDTCFLLKKNLWIMLISKTILEEIFKEMNK